MLNKIMQAIGRRRIHASISYNTPLNNSNKTIYDKLKTRPFKNLVKSIECKLLDMLMPVCIAMACVYSSSFIRLKWLMSHRVTIPF